MAGRRYTVYDQTDFFERFPTPELRSTGFDWALYQLMVCDRPRMEAYRADIADLVPGRSVLEIGPGSHAVLTVCAADAGAASILSVEANAWAAAAARRRMRRYADQVQILTGHTDRVTGDELGEPRHFDVLLLECYHSIASQEAVVETVTDLRRRGFTFGAIISSGFTTYVAPAIGPRSAPMTALERVAMGWPARRRSADAAMVRRRSTLHGDMVEIASQRLGTAQQWQWCDLEGDGRLDTATTLRFDVERLGDVAGLQFFNRFDFHHGALDTGTTATHWGVYFLPLPLGLPAGSDGPGELVVHSAQPVPNQPSVVELVAEAAGVATAPIRL